jgi:hypothetical protein
MIEELVDLLGDRGARGAAMLCDAVRLDFARFLSDEVEGRLRARPNLAERTPRMDLVKLRVRLEDRLNRLVASSEEPVRTLRAQLVLFPRDNAEELEALRAAIAPLVEEAARQLLLRFGFPGDAIPDHADKPIADLHPAYELHYAPSETLVWAFGQVRMLDTASRLYTLAEGSDVPETFEIRCFLPEALPEKR